MANLKENKAREHRIEMEVVVDAYNSEERAMGWFYYVVYYYRGLAGRF